MKTVEIKKRPDWKDPFVEKMMPRDASEGVQVFVDGKNILGEEDEIRTSFCNRDYETSDGYAAVELLAALERSGLFLLQYDDEIKKEYARQLQP